ncbi:PTS sugar transporter subunit IIC [Holdemania massiliensis]|uniref:PTS sugar transporter subunit IIC n=1 Tax=Holdemania massiliensis TaxID=1468449 RepID=UPI001F06E2CA|nr:PTS transporter subunit EIIC [Holdemania massiliensis]MCH1941955.1 PTS transporter subunit EIIC [Holdemania massiliensis]
MKFLDHFEERLSGIVGWLDSNRYINALKEGMFLAMPVMMIGSLFALLMNFPIPAFTQFVVSLFGDAWNSTILTGYFCTMGMVGLLFLIGISRSLAKAYEMNEVYTISAVLIAYVLIMPFNGDAISVIGCFGTSQILTVLIVSIIAVELLHFIEKRGWTIKLPKEVPAFVSKSFSALIPEFLLIFVFLMIRVIFGLTPYGYLDAFIIGVISAPLGKLATSVPGIILLIVISNVTYWFGISPGTIGSIFEPFLLANTAANNLAYLNGSTGTAILDSCFRDQITCIGGSGGTIGLVICMLIFARSKQNKAVGKMSAIPALFNVNEPVVFGAPVIFNIRLLVPFVLSPVVSIIIAYLSMMTGLVPVSNGIQLPFTIPIGLKAFFNYGWQGTLLQLGLVVVQVLIWMPFFKAYDKDLIKKEAAAVESNEEA